MSYIGNLFVFVPILYTNYKHKCRSTLLPITLNYVGNTIMIAFISQLKY